MTDSKNDLTIMRVYDVSRELLFRAWTDPKLVAQWWGPRGVTNPMCQIDLRPGGKINIVMLAGEELGDMKGNRWPMEGTVEEIEEPSKIVWVSSAIMGGKPILDNRITVTFDEAGGKTKMTLHVAVTRVTPEAAGPLAGMKAGWTQSIDKLGELLKKERG